MKNQRREIIQASLLAWYDNNHRPLPWRESEDPYHIWVSEVMLQQTQVKTVIPYYRRFLKQFPTIQALATADLQTVLKMWEGLGYYGRARNLHRAAAIVVSDYVGILPKTWKEIRKLPGIGDYIASAILSIAFDLPYAVVDGNVKRVLARLNKINTPVNQSASTVIFKKHAERLLKKKEPGKFNQAMMEIGALVCMPLRPSCGSCPIQQACKAYQSNTVSVYPKRAKTKPTPLYNIAVGIVTKSGHVLITRRRDEGLLGGLWEFPGGKIREAENPETACIREIKEETGIEVKIRKYLTSVRHAYTHFKIVVHVFICDYISGHVKLNGPVDYDWITLDDIDTYPLPKANHKFVPMVKEALQSNPKGCIPS